MRNRWVYLSIAAIVLLSVFAVSVVATPAINGERAKERFKARKSERIGQVLGLTDEQREQIRDVLGKYRDDFRSLVREMSQAQQNLRDAIMADSYNEKAIRDASEKVNAYRTEIALLAGKVYQDIGKILTPEQKRFIDEWKRKRRDYISDLRELFENLPTR